MTDIANSNIGYYNMASESVSILWRIELACSKKLQVIPNEVSNTETLSKLDKIR